MKIKPETDSNLKICGGYTTNTSAELELYGKDDSNNAGKFVLTARNNSNNTSVKLEGSADGTLKWNGNDIGCHTVGEIISIIGCGEDYVPYGCVPCNGEEYSSTQFPTLWEGYLTSSPTAKLSICTYADYTADITTYGQCSKWAVDTVNKTFKVPTIKDGSVLQQALNNSELGKAYNAGLPNFVCVAGDTINQSIMDWSAWNNSLNNKFDYNRDFTIIYPNGGTAESPANVTVNSRYVMDNPFEGYEVYCVAEIKLNGVWGKAGWGTCQYNNTWYSYGVKASTYNNQIIVQTGSYGNEAHRIITGSGFNNDSTQNQPAPCRVKVWKIGKVVT